MHGCELTKEGRKRGYSQFAYDGKDYLSLDKETLTWTATDSRAQVTKRRWDTDRVWTEGRRNFVEGRCVEWLQKYLDYGKETLLRRGEGAECVCMGGGRNSPPPPPGWKLLGLSALWNGQRNSLPAPCPSFLLYLLAS